MELIYNKISKNIAMFYILTFSSSYIIFPYLFEILSGNINTYGSTVAKITLVSNFFVLLGIFVHFNLSLQTKFILLSYETTVKIIFSIFIMFISLCFITAEKIPLISSLQGADSLTLSIARAKFLKAREGWQQSFVYINAILGGGIVPYLICLAFERGYKYKYLLLFIFFLYSISFLEKAYFLKIGLPLFFFYYTRSKRKIVFAATSITIIVFLLTLMSFLAGKGINVDVIDNDESFFSAYYVSQTPFEKIIWRAVVIPVVTSIDAIKLFYEKYSGQFLLGSTNSTISLLFGMKRIEYEREVFSSQWGQGEGGTGAANSVFVTEAFVNFGYIGVILFSFIVGRIIFYFSINKYLSMKAISFLFIYSIFNSGLLSTLLSNAYLVLLLISFFITWDKTNKV